MLLNYSQSTEDSEPVYEQPISFERCHSDSEAERASSASPPFCDSPYNTVTDDVYSEISPRDTDHLIKPSQGSHVKSRRNMYAGKFQNLLETIAGVSCCGWWCVGNI